MSKPDSFHLTESQIVQLVTVISEDPRETMMKRAAALWFLHNGVSISAVMREFDIKSRSTLYNWWHRLQESGIEGLLKQRCHLSVDDAYRVRLEAVLAQPPQTFGFNAPGWTVDTLLEQMGREMTIKLSKTRMHKLLRMLGYLYRIGYLTPIYIAKRPTTLQELQALVEMSKPLCERPAYNMWHQRPVNIDEIMSILYTLPEKKERKRRKQA